IAGLSGSAEAARDVSIGISWAASRPTSAPSFRRADFPPDAIAIIREAARIFRESGPLEGVYIVGVVVHLWRAPEALEGVATVAALVEGRARQLTVALRGQEYELAIEAHRTKAPLAFEADVVREGRTFRAINVRDLQMLPPA